MFEAGRHQEVVEAATHSTDPCIIYPAGVSLLQLDRRDDAGHRFDRRQRLPETDTWHFIRAASEILHRPGAEDDLAMTAQAEEAARAAVAVDDALMDAHY